ncbi:hypothetical protein J6TS7_07550 [Paenibacillus dendritiformis]|uniref:adenylyl-sulfate kinase n=1 Tax=Paenibacillus TaxID=44249 RepID=UPI001B1C5E58|nr:MULTISPECIES: adenylyl-sulfate kinase [Paenibacillus]MEB9896618.1 adenylyl-sulfate kinase [Bacillus cereus]GIO77145.1 hypothetical protein J6TS7_07550 [Paenibacillus dendritiformis]
MSEHAFTLWLTGYSGAGKTTMAQAIAASLRSHGRRVECLDGDELRAAIGKVSASAGKTGWRISAGSYILAGCWPATELFRPSR